MSQVDALHIVSPLGEEVLQTVLSDMNHGTLQEALFERLQLTAILEAVESGLSSSLEHTVQDLRDATGSERGRLFVALPHRLSRVMPVLEAASQVEVARSLDDLHHLAHELPVLVRVLLDGFEARAHDTAVPLDRGLLGFSSEVDGRLGALEPFAQCLALLDVRAVTA